MLPGPPIPGSAAGKQPPAPRKAVAVLEQLSEGEAPVVKIYYDGDGRAERQGRRSKQVMTKVSAE